QLVRRLDPPGGVWMHWSRLLDGALAAMNWALGAVLPADRAEWATRFFWPLLWIPPVVAGGLIIARETGSRSAVLVAASILVTFIPIYRQFFPGRVDHHNVQITMAVLALAGALSRAGAGRERINIVWATIAGAAGGFG